MGIQKDILSKINLTQQQKKQLASLGNDAGAIGKFLNEQGIRIPEDMQGILGNVTETVMGRASDAADGARNAAQKAGTAGRNGLDSVEKAVKGALDNTDLDDRLMDGIKGLGRRK